MEWEAENPRPAPTRCRGPPGRKIRRFMANDEALDIKAAGVLAEKMTCAEVALLYIKTLERTEIEAVADGDLTSLTLPD